MTRSAIWLGVLLIWILPCNTSRGDLLFEFGVGDVIMSDIEIPVPGATVPIQVYLSQTGTTTILSDEGLAFAGVRVTFDDPTIAAVLSDTNIQENPAFDLDSPPFFPEKEVTGTTAELIVGVDDIFSPVFADSNGRVLLGEFTFTGLSLGSTNIRAEILDAGGLDYIISGTGVELDGLITPASATLTVTPEPGSVGLALVALGGAAVVGVYRSRRKRRKTSTEDPSVVAG